MKKSIIACLAVATCSLGLGAQTPALAADYGRITVEGHAETTYVANQSMVVATVETKGTSIQAAKAWLFLIRIFALAITKAMMKTIIQLRIAM